jgi:ferrous iron transport protein B
VALNLMDEAERHGLNVDPRALSRDLGVPVVPMVARRGEGIQELLQAISQVAHGEFVTRPHRIRQRDSKLENAITTLVDKINDLFPGLPNTRWVALRLLDGDASIKRAIEEGTLGDLSTNQTAESAPLVALEAIS